VTFRDSVTWKTLLCVVFPDSAEIISQLVALLADADALFLLLNGGHSMSPGDNNIEDGVLVDVSGIRAVSLNAR